MLFLAYWDENNFEVGEWKCISVVVRERLDFWPCFCYYVDCQTIYDRFMIEFSVGTQNFFFFFLVSTDSFDTQTITNYKTSQFWLYLNSSLSFSPSTDPRIDLSTRDGLFNQIGCHQYYDQYGSKLNYCFCNEPKCNTAMSITRSLPLLAFVYVSCLLNALL